jgi:hypothetical protein
MSQKYEKPILKTFRSEDAEVAQGVPCASGGNPGDACTFGNKAGGFTCTTGSTAGCQVGSTYTGS